MAVKQYQESGVCKLVTETTVDQTGLWLRATAVGQLDELMGDQSFFRYIVSSTGAVLDPAADGLRVHRDALGDALAGGSEQQIGLKISKQPTQAITDSDLIVFETPIGTLHKTTRLDVVTGGAIAAWTLLGNPTSGSGSQVAFKHTDIAIGSFEVTAYALGYDSTGAFKRYALSDYLRSVDLDGVASPTDYKIANSAGSGVTIGIVDDVNSGLMTPADWQLLHSISSGSTNLDTVADETTVTVTNTTGTDATIQQVGLNAAGVLSVFGYQQLLNIFPGQDPNGLFTSFAGYPGWATKDAFTLRPTLSSTRLVGWDASGNLSVFAPATGGSSDVSNVVHLAQHNLVVGDLMKPFSSISKGVWDDTSGEWPSGIVTGIIDADTIEVAIPGTEIVVPTALVEVGFDLATDGGWMSWDDSVGTYVSARPTDSIADGSELIEIVGATSGGWFAIARDHGPLGTGGGGTGSSPPPVEGTEEVELSSGGGGTPQPGFKCQFDTLNGDIYTESGGAWKLFGDGDQVDTSTSSTLDATNYAGILLQAPTPRDISAISGGHPKQTLVLVSQNGNAAVQNTASILLEGGDSWAPGASGGSLTLRTFDGSTWFETSRVTYTAFTNVVAKKVQ